MLLHIYYFFTSVIVRKINCSNYAMEVFFKLLLVQLIAGCIVGGEWSNWEPFSRCSQTCGVEGRMTRVRSCISNNRTCTGAGKEILKCGDVPCKKDNKCNCGCILTGNTGYINSMSITKAARACTWTIRTKPGTSISLHVKDLSIEQGKLFITGPESIYQKLTIAFGEKVKVPFTVNSISNTLNVTLFYDQSKLGEKMSFVGTYRAAAAAVVVEVVKTSTVKPATTNQGSSINVAMIIGISVCVFVIGLASFILGYRKFRRRNSKNEEHEEGVEDNYSSASSSGGRSGRNKGLSPLKSRHSPACHVPLQTRDLSPIRNDEVKHGLLTNPYDGTPRGYPDGTEIFIPSNSNVMMPGQGGYITQPYANWPLRQPYPDEYQQAQMTDLMIKQAQISYTPQVMYNQSRTYQYATSGGEG